MALLHDEFRSLLSSATFKKRICAFIIDEAHIIKQWGESKFREMYSRLGTLRAFVGESIPFLITSATLAPDVLADVRKSVHIEPSQTFHVNLGNDRHNITWHVRRMDGNKSNVEALEFLLPEDRSAKRLERGLVFFDSIDVAMDAWRWFTSQLSPEAAARVGLYHARRGSDSKDFAYEEFCKGNLDILFCTEAAGMVRTFVAYSKFCISLTARTQGCDMPDVSFVVQYLVPGSLSIWLQRAGRAARRLGSQGRAYLLVQPSVFQEKNKSQRTEDDDVEYVKMVEEDLRRWIETEECRRNVQDECFNNPIIRKRECCWYHCFIHTKSLVQLRLATAATTVNGKCSLPSAKLTILVTTTTNLPLHVLPLPMPTTSQMFPMIRPTTTRT